MIRKLKAGYLAVLLVVVGCSSSENRRGSISTPNVQGPTIEAGTIPINQGKAVTLSNGAEIYVRNRGGKLYFTVEGLVSPQSFPKLLSKTSWKPENEKKEILKQEINKIFFSLRKDANSIGLSQYPQFGYFTFEAPYQADLMSPLKAIRTEYSLILNPVLHQPEIISDLNATAEMAPPRSISRSSTRGMSGLEQVHAVEFAKQLEKELGVPINGSSVRVGVTDTGVTLNHPTFEGRVAYLRDFTREGRVYFSSVARFEVNVPANGSEDDLILQAEVILTPKLPDMPSGDQLTLVKNLTIKVSPELKKILLRPGNGAKLGILDESVFQSDEDTVDLNGNGSLEDKIFLILVPGVTSKTDVVYADFSGTADFRNSKPIADWNVSQQTATVFAEKVGFDFREDTLPTSDGKSKVAVRSVSIVGYDPGNHGTHVSGIIAGARTIKNDDPNTLARGVAPGTTLLVNRVCANNYGCNASEAIADLAENAQAEVINMSLGGLNPFNDGNGVQETLINRLTVMKNLLFVISAGNSGPGRQTVGSPSTARLALSVGASATQEMIQRQYEWPGNGKPDADFMLFFSSRGPTSSGGFKPSLTAPGTELSSIQLNAAPGSHRGLAVYWGTSMAAPTMTGSYALFLDGVKKYNQKFPNQALPTDVKTLRDVLIQSARPFDVSRLDVETGEKLKGQYTWIDQGLGMVDLTAAWKLLLDLRDHPTPSAVQLAGKSVPLDYQILVPMKAPNGISYDGTRRGLVQKPSFGSGVYLSYSDTDVLRQVHITRSLPEDLRSSSQAGELITQLSTTADEFTLKTYIYGSDVKWLKVGTLDQQNCSDSETANLLVIGEGATVSKSSDGTLTLNSVNSSGLNLCLDRQKISNELPPGDHGALIFGYLKGSRLASFIVPVYLTVPHQTLANSTGYDVTRTVSSFEVSRNYVSIPQGTTLARVSLEAIPVKGEGATQGCSGVELMALVGGNTLSPIKERKKAQVSTCDSNGRILSDDSARKISFTLQKPVAGVWDLHVFGSYRFPKSQYRLKVDYLLARTSLEEIKGGIGALSGSLDLALYESSLKMIPDSNKSSYYLAGLRNLTNSQVRNGEHTYVASPLGMMRSYPDSVSSVKISIGNSPGNDIDLFVAECSKDARDPNDPSCNLIGSSDGATDEETVSFVPSPGRVYLVRVDGADVKDEGKFTLNETLLMENEKGEITVAESPNHTFDIKFLMPQAQIDGSKILHHELFKSKKYFALGSLDLTSADGARLASLPVKISSEMN